MVGVPKRCGDFMAILLRACEEFANNRFNLLFIIDSDMMINTEYCN